MKIQIRFLIFFLSIFTLSVFAQFHSIVLKNDGTVYTWGRNYFGQLGIGNTTDKNLPVAITTSGALLGKNIIKVDAGNDYSMVLTSDGTLYSWGTNSSGQLGTGDNVDSHVPVAVTTSGALTGKTITAFSAGAQHSVAVASTGAVFGWGYNAFGQLGIGTNGSGVDKNVPVAVDMSGVLNGMIVTAVAAGADHTVALASNGTVYAWGLNTKGQVGDGTTTAVRNAPVAVNVSGVLAGKKIKAVAAGESHCVVLADDGKVYTWGDNSYGQLGNGNNTDSNVPVEVITSGAIAGKSIVAISAGGLFSVALASDGTVYTWGYNSSGQLGYGNNTDSNVPVAVTTSGVLAGKTITVIDAGHSHCLVVASNGSVFTWGYGTYGQLGIGDNVSYKVPVAVDQSIMGLLPVELTSFTGSKTDAGVVLNWSTATEINNKGFEIERRTSTTEFQSIGFVQGNGTTSEEHNYTFEDNGLSQAIYYYRLKQIDLDGTFAYSSVVEIDNNTTPTQFALGQNYPNPFNPETSIEFALPVSGKVKVIVYSTLGEVIAEVANGAYSAGSHKLTWNAASSGVASGVYFYEVSVIGDNGKEFREMKKMTLLK